MEPKYLSKEVIIHPLLIIWGSVIGSLGYVLLGYKYLDIVDMKKLPLGRDFLSERVQILHTWKIQVYPGMISTYLSADEIYDSLSVSLCIYMYLWV